MAVKLVVEFLVTDALLPLIVIVGSVPVMMSSSEVSSSVISSLTIARSELFALSDSIVTVVNEGACLSKVTPPSTSLITAII